MSLKNIAVSLLCIVVSSLLLYSTLTMRAEKLRYFNIDGHARNAYVPLFNGTRNSTILNADKQDVTEKTIKDIGFYAKTGNWARVHEYFLAHRLSMSSTPK